jgi:hypothetical protein
MQRKCLIQEISKLTIPRIAFKNSEKEEIIEDKFLRDITHELLHWISSKLDPPYPSGSKEKPPMGAIANFILSNEQLLIPILHGVVSSMTWLDSVAFNKSINLCTNLVPYLVQISKNDYKDDLLIFL